MFWKDLKLSIELDDLKSQFDAEFFINGEFNVNDNRVTDVVTGYLIVAKELDWMNDVVSTAIGAKVSTVRIFITKPNTYFPIHRDCKGGKTSLREWAVNIPLLNCDKGYNQWFSDEDNDFGNEVYIEGGSAVQPENIYKKYNVTERQILNCPKIIRTDIHHNVDNTDNDKMRVVLSYRSDDEMSWSEIISKI